MKEPRLSVTYPPDSLSLNALARVATEIRQDAKSNDPQLHAFAVQMLGGIAQLADMIQRAATLDVIDSQGLGPAFTDATIAVGDYRPA